MSRGPTYHPTAQSLHWITAVAVIGMLGVGLWMTGLPRIGDWIDEQWTRHIGQPGAIAVKASVESTALARS